MKRVDYGSKRRRGHRTAAAAAAAVMLLHRLRRRRSPTTNSGATAKDGIGPAKRFTYSARRTTVRRCTAVGTCCVGPVAALFSLSLSLRSFCGFFCDQIFSDSPSSASWWSRIRNSYTQFGAVLSFIDLSSTILFYIGTNSNRFASKRAKA